MVLTGPVLFALIWLISRCGLAVQGQRSARWLSHSSRTWRVSSSIGRTWPLMVSRRLPRSTSSRRSSRIALRRAACIGVGPATEPFRTLRRFRRGQDGCLRGSLAYVPVPVQPGCDLDAEAGSPAGVALGDGDLRVRKSSVTDKINLGHRPGRVNAM